MILLVGFLPAGKGVAETAGPNSRGHQFVALEVSKSFAESSEPGSGQVLLTSRVIHTAVDFDEVIVSWNADLPRDVDLVVEARAICGERTTRYYNLGIWSQNTTDHPRQSIEGQTDGDGDVSTDTLRLHRPANGLELRLTLRGRSADTKALRFIGVSLTDSRISPPPLAANRKAWGRLIPVPERSQMAYPNGKVLCSPTTVSMLLGYWAQRLHRSELDRPVPEVADAIYDSQWKGTGNWPFNTAYAGAFPGIRAYVARFSDVAELEAWIARNLPVGLSLDYDRLRGKGPGPNGHLVVLVGFTKQGDPIVNDPGTSEHVRKVFPRGNLINAWACSRNTVYLIYPEDASLPKDKFGHWDSPLVRNLRPFPGG